MSKKLAQDLNEKVLETLREETPQDSADIVITYVRKDFVDAIEKVLPGKNNGQGSPRSKLAAH